MDEESEDYQNLKRQLQIYFLQHPIKHRQTSAEDQRNYLFKQFLSPLFTKEPKKHTTRALITAFDKILEEVMEESNGGGSRKPRRRHKTMNHRKRNVNTRRRCHQRKYKSRRNVSRKYQRRRSYKKR